MKILQGEEDLETLIRKTFHVTVPIFIIYCVFISFLEQMFVPEHIHFNSNTQYRFGILYLNTLGTAAKKNYGGVEDVALEQGQSTVYLSFSNVVFSVSHFVE